MAEKEPSRWTRGKLLIQGLCTVGLAALALPQINNILVVRGFDTGFRADPIAGRESRALRLTTADRKDLVCSLDLVVAMAVPDSGTFVAVLAKRETLNVAVESIGPGTRRVTIENSDSTGGRFTWRSGTGLDFISSTSSTAPLQVVDWHVYLRDDDFDSQERAGKRLPLGILLVGLVALLTLGNVIAAAWPEKPAAPEPITVERYVSQQILEVQLEKPEETELVRAALKKVALGDAGIEEAVAAIGVSTRLEKVGLWIQARNALRERFQNFIGLLAAYDQRLGRGPRV